MRRQRHLRQHRHLQRRGRLHAGGDHASAAPPRPAAGTTFTPTAFCSGGGTCSTACHRQLRALRLRRRAAATTTCNADTDCVPAGGKNSYCTGDRRGRCLPVKATGVACFSQPRVQQRQLRRRRLLRQRQLLRPARPATSPAAPARCANVADAVAEPHSRCGANGTCGNTGTCTGAAPARRRHRASAAPRRRAAAAPSPPPRSARGAAPARPPRTPAAPPTSAAAPAAATSAANDTQCVPSGGVNTYCTGTNGSCLPVKADGRRLPLRTTSAAPGTASTASAAEAAAARPARPATSPAAPARAPTSLPASPIRTTAARANGTCGNTGTCNGRRRLHPGLDVRRLRDGLLHRQHLHAGGVLHRAPAAARRPRPRAARPISAAARPAATAATPTTTA